MSDTNVPLTADLPGNPLNDPRQWILGEKTGVTFMDQETPLTAVQQMPLPGIVIFVHGVNSDGEWYTQAEEGLCKGLNDRLKRNAGQIAYPTVAGGQLKPVKYMPGLTPDGFINPKMNDKNFILPDESFSPVIHFRWGYKANGQELQDYGKTLYLNEDNYWGGGPFANGCTSLPDLWGKGLEDNLFLFLHVQHFNPVNDRMVYACPPRPYFVVAALRLAKLVQSLREKQANVPITIVCHSQGNMIGMAAAFIGDRMPPVKDDMEYEGRCVADNYVLCNPPYSLVEKNVTEGWTSYGMKDNEGKGGRQTLDARVKTLAAFFDIIRQQAPTEQDPALVDALMKNEAEGFNARGDRAKYGFGTPLSTYGRVTLYCCPHDQVISASAVQGMGWRGLSDREIKQTNGLGIFCQRVFSQGFKVGEKGRYDYWADQYNKPTPGSQDFWFPESPIAQYSVTKGSEATTGMKKAMTYVFSPVMIMGMKLATVRINALPPQAWAITVDAPELQAPFVPESLRFGKASTEFDQGSDAPAESRDKNRLREANDPYAGDRLADKHSTDAAKRKGNDAAEGDRETEAALRYEHHAMLRMQAKREGLYKPMEKVVEENDPSKASEKYKAWRSEKIQKNLAQNINSHATDHSTIMTNGMHAQKALAYDVAIGSCHIKKDDLDTLRASADWRFLKGLPADELCSTFLEYFQLGTMDADSTYTWANKKGSDGRMPKKIINKRELFPGRGNNAENK
jgi:pimeloyl-ACP methyl ester carboxylesterase